jgi:hypothetical protein
MDHWPAISDLSVVIESCTYGRIDPGEEFGQAHPTRTVTLSGRRCEGMGEDITLFMGGEGPDLPLEGEWTMGSFCEHMAAVDQWPDGEPSFGEMEGTPEFLDMARRWRNWAYESAALDLALAQAETSLHELIGREARPVSYVNSFGMNETDIVGKSTRRLEQYPDLRFKLDVSAHWTEDVVEALAATGAVHTVDFKGRYGLEIEDPEGLPALYERVLGGLPNALVEDPHLLPEITPLVAPHAERVSYDAPIHTVADIDALPVPARTLNIKPSRIGRLRDLFALYDACEQRGLAMYGGGMGELGVGRGQIQLLASIFSPDGPNDIAPPGFNAVELAEGLPPSPLDPEPAPTGFRRRADA